MQKELLKISRLYKSYGEVVALKDFNLIVGEGEIVGLLGPNGAGKTTLISILSGVVKGFSGQVEFKGQNLFANRKLKNDLGIVPQDMAFYEDLNAMDNMMFWGGLYDISRSKIKKRAEELLTLVGLIDRDKEPIKNYSGGMKRRLNVAIGLIHQPMLLLMDEPTVGIDVQTKIHILEIVKNVAAQGTAVIFTTHQLKEVEEICSQIVIMDKGEILARGTLKELIRIVGEKEIVEISGEFSASQASEILKRTGETEIVAVSDNQINLAVDNTARIPSLLELLFKKQLKVNDLKIKSPSLEMVFLKLTGRSLRD